MRSELPPEPVRIQPLAEPGGGDHAVVAEGLSKAFRLARGRGSGRLGRSAAGEKARAREVWALRHVSLEVARGEAVGILGRNGAGKSTLLEILAGTRQPTEGQALVRGRVAALLQLGAGFHPEFTGRENVFLAGSIQGFSRQEALDRYDDIAAFADIGNYLDQPVKTYSSGMYARLAFAVATAYEPDILIVDEILAVGDAPFQQKCVTRIERMRENGLTLLFVSHSVDRVNALCDRAIVLEAGRRQFFGETSAATDFYLKSLRTEPSPSKPNAVEPSEVREAPHVTRQTRGLDRYGSQEVRILSVETCDASGEPCEDFAYGDRIGLRVAYHAGIATEDLSVSFLVRDETGVNLCGTMTWDEQLELPPVAPGDSGRVVFQFVNRLRPGRFGICVAITRINRADRRKPFLYDQIDGVASFVSEWNVDRPIHYKFDAEIDVEVEKAL